MTIESDGVHHYDKRNTYWTRVQIKSEDRESIVLVCAPWTYIMDIFRLNASIQKEHLDRWLELVLNDIKENAGIYLNNPVNYKVYSISEEGKKNGLEFLMNEVTP